MVIDASHSTEHSRKGEKTTARKYRESASGNQMASSAGHGARQKYHIPAREPLNVSFEQDRYESEWDERDAVMQPYDDEIESREATGYETERTYIGMTHPPRLIYKNPETYNDNHFRF